MQSVRCDLLHLFRRSVKIKDSSLCTRSIELLPLARNFCGGKLLLQNQVNANWKWNIFSSKHGFSGIIQTTPTSKCFYSHTPVKNIGSSGRFRFYLKDRRAKDVIQEYENKPKNHVAHQDVLRYMLAVLKTLETENKMPYANLKDGRLLSAFRSMFERNFIQELNPREMNDLLFIVKYLDRSAILRYCSELDRYVSHSWNEWTVEQKLHLAKQWLHLSHLHRHTYMEDGISSLLKTLQGQVNKMSTDEYMLLCAIIYNHTVLNISVLNRQGTLKQVHHSLLNEIEARLFGIGRDMPGMQLHDYNRFLAACSTTERTVPIDVIKRMLIDVEERVPGVLHRNDNLFDLQSFLISILNAVYAHHSNSTYHPALVSNAAEIAEKILPKLKLHHSVRIVHRFAKQRLCDHQMLDIIQRACVSSNFNNINQLNGRHISQLLESCALMNYKDIQFFDRVLKVKDSEHLFKDIHQYPFCLVLILNPLFCFGYHKEYDGLLDIFFSEKYQEKLEKKVLSGNVNSKNASQKVINLIGSLEVEQVEKFLPRVPVHLYRLPAIQERIKHTHYMKEWDDSRCLLSSILSVLGGQNLARFVTLPHLHTVVTEMCFDTSGIPVDLRQVPEVVCKNGHLNMDAVAQIPCGWKKVALFRTHHEHHFINKQSLIGFVENNLEHLKLMGYSEILQVPIDLIKSSSPRELNSYLRDKLSTIEGLKIPS